MIDGEGKIYISMEDYTKFVISQSGLPDGSYFVFGEPKIVDGEVEVNYAFSTITSPSTWANKPDWMLKK